MTIFDLPTLEAAKALALAQETIATHSGLARIYDEAFIVNLVRRRRAYDNVLLLRLVEPDDEITSAYWRGVTDDLTTLEPEGAFEAFRDKLRRHEGPALESARTELWFPAWLKRHGTALALEPQVGTRKCEFVARTTPETWWEIKSPLDLPSVQDDAAVQTDIQRRLRRIDEPFVLRLCKADLTLAAVPKAVKSIKRQLATFHSGGGKPPNVFEANGLVVSVDSFTKRPNGYLGVMLVEQFGIEAFARALTVRKHQSQQRPPATHILNLSAERPTSPHGYAVRVLKC